MKERALDETRPPQRAVIRKLPVNNPDAPYEIVGSVAPEDAPLAHKRRVGGIWADLADKVVADHQAGFVTVVMVDDDPLELKRMRSGMTIPIRERVQQLRLDTRYRLNMTTMPATPASPGRRQVYLRLLLKH